MNSNRIKVLASIQTGNKSVMRTYNMLKHGDPVKRATRAIQRSWPNAEYIHVSTIQE